MNYKGEDMKIIKQYILYILRWELSTPILALCIYLLPFETTIKTICANFIGALIFFWIDKWIFKSSTFLPIWDIEEKCKCTDCGKVSRGYRLVRTKNYDKSNDKQPQFRCEKCSQKKLEQLKNKGVAI